MPSCLIASLVATAFLALLYLALVIAIARVFSRAPASCREDSIWTNIALEVSFPSRDRRVRVAGSFLNVADPAGAVILVHGRGGSRGHELSQHVVKLAKRLLEVRLSVLIVDLRGHGLSSAAPLTYGLQERHDVLGAVDWLCNQGYLPGTIGAMGASMGGAAVIAAAAEEPALGVIVVDSAFADFRSLARESFLRMAHWPGAALVFPGALLAMNIMTGARVGTFAPVQLIPLLCGRAVLIVHADEDDIVPPAHAVRLADAAGTTPWITSSRGHVSSLKSDPTAYGDRVLAFLASHLSAASSRS